MDLSDPFGDSVNDYSFQVCKSHDEVILHQTAGVGGDIAKQDVKHAFRLIPVRSENWHLLGY